ncbi:MAG TPA: hypothetical protein VMT51_15700 [Dongiaceae bacterium]|nr:hypothetical protein [Dongiaceae bacterium]
MNKILIRVGLSVLGCVATLVWWTYHDKGSTAQAISHIPDKILEGGNTMEIFADASTPATLRLSFEDLSKPAGKQIILEAWEKIPAGTHTWTVSVPSGVGGYVELGADHPNAGDTLEARVKVNGQEVDAQKDRLEKPLESNTAFFVQFQHDDFSKAQAEHREANE